MTFNSFTNAKVNTNDITTRGHEHYNTKKSGVFFSHVVIFMLSCYSAFTMLPSKFTHGHFNRNRVSCFRVTLLCRYVDECKPGLPDLFKQ